ncbi:MAG: hypothetical protein EXR76_11015 [Myxococcales bacterium]|nr:hypothetical protein [Myxococcales bacterium]
MLCNGFVAGVRLDGQATAEVDDDGVRIYGVFPGSLAATGPALATGLANFRLGFRKVLIDIAFESPEFEAFKCEVERFFHETNPEAIADWEEARRLIRAGQSAPEAFSRDTSNRLPTVKVALLALQAKENRRVECDTPLVAA